MQVTDLKTGTIYKENGVPLQVVKYTHVKVARGGATVKVKVKNLINGSVLEKSYVASTSVEDADVRRKNMQYLYKDRDYIFMDPDTYEQISLAEDTIGDQVPYLEEGSTVQMVYFEDKPISITLPNSIIYEVTYTEPGFKGNTVTNVYKDATVSNGMIVKVPTFIKIGDKVKIDTRTGEYLSRE